MAIDEIYFTQLDLVITELQRVKNNDTLNVLCLSYPDIIFSSDFFSEKKKASRIFSNISFDDVLLTHKLFLAYNCDVTYIDVKKLKGIEIVEDLNTLLPKAYIKKYDLVVDTGTLEHCFNYGVAFVNMCNSLKLGGKVISTAPCTMVNHGFFNISPTLYVDAFEQNGFSLNKIYLRTFGKNSKFMSILDKATSRFQVPPECGILAIATKIQDIEFQYPVQTKYKSMLT
jgi:hypothetical protein